MAELPIGLQDAWLRGRVRGGRPPAEDGDLEKDNSCSPREAALHPRYKEQLASKRPSSVADISILVILLCRPEFKFSSRLGSAVKMQFL